MLDLPEHVLRRRVYNEKVNRRLRETTILKALPPYLKPGIAVDVGAATGHITRFLMDHYDEIWAFEAVEPVFCQLAKWEEQNPDVHAVLAAVSSYEGRGKIYVDDKRLSNSGFLDLVGGLETEVPVVRLDSYFGRQQSFDDKKFGFLKVDVEGTEYDVLYGARNIIERDHPTLMVEVYEPYSAYPLHTVFSFLKEFGYSCYFWSRPDLVPVPTQPDFVHAVKYRHAEHDGDFLFVKEDKSSV